MTTGLKQRIVGAIFILSLGVILIPIILDKPEEKQETLVRAIPDSPAMPDVSEVSKIHYIFNDKATVAATEAETPVANLTEVTTVAEAEPTPSLPVAVEEPTSPDPAPLPVAIETPKTEKPIEKAKTTLTKTTQTEWTIQLGAFSSEKNAKALLQKLSQGGFEPYLREMTHDSLVRVFVSKGIPREEAQALALKLDTEYGLKGIVVRYFQ